MTKRCRICMPNTPALVNVVHCQCADDKEEESSNEHVINGLDVTDLKQLAREKENTIVVHFHINMFQIYSIHFYSHLLKYGLPGHKYLSILHSVSEIIKKYFLGFKNFKNCWVFFYTTKKKIYFLENYSKALETIMITYYDYFTS